MAPGNLSSSATLASLAVNVPDRVSHHHPYSSKGKGPRRSSRRLRGLTYGSSSSSSSPTSSSWSSESSDASSGPRPRSYHQEGAKDDDDDEINPSDHRGVGAFWSHHNGGNDRNMPNPTCKGKKVIHQEPPNSISVPSHSSHDPKNPYYDYPTSPMGRNMLSSQTYKSINLNRSSGEPDEISPLRLVTYTLAGQGFTWNEELFLPSYLRSRYGRKRRRFENGGAAGGDTGWDGEEAEIAEIVVTDEEAESFFP